MAIYKEMCFSVNTTLVETRNKILKYISDTGGKIKKQGETQIIASYGSALKIRLLGTLFAGLKAYPRDVDISFGESEENVLIKISIIDTFGIGLRVGIKDDLNNLFTGQASEIKSIFTNQIAKPNLEKPIINNVETNSATEFSKILEKYDMLVKNNIFTKEEFITKKENLINELKTKTISGNPEDFLLTIVGLKTKGILTSEDIILIKKNIFVE